MTTPKVTRLGFVMQVTINGQVETVDAGWNVGDLLRARRLEPQQVAIEINERLVSRDDYARTVIRAGDVIEIVTFVGGG